MNNELNAIELSNDELDTVAGGLAITLGNVGGFASDASNSYSLKQLQVGQQTFASPTDKAAPFLFVVRSRLQYAMYIYL